MIVGGGKGSCRVTEVGEEESIVNNKREREREIVWTFLQKNLSLLQVMTKILIPDILFFAGSV